LEFLFIVIVIISIISSISKNIKRQMKKETPFDPWSFDSDSDIKIDNEKKLQKEEFTEEESVVEQKAEERLITKQEDFQEVYPDKEVIGDDSFQPYIEIKNDNKTTFLQDLQDQKKEDTSIIATGEMDRELKTLLTGKKLPLGVIASEVLGPPRALKPYKHR